MTRFRASFSILSLWSSGQQEEAVKAYFKLPRIETKAMSDGKAYHHDWSLHIINTGNLPDVLGGKTLTNPKTEVKISCQLEEWLELVGIPDCIDGNVLYEFKTGTTSSSAYAQTFQAGVYGLIARMNDIPLTQAVFIRYNQYTKRTDISYVWLTEYVLDQAREWVITYASDMHNFLTENGLYDQYMLPEIEEEDIYFLNEDL